MKWPTLATSRPRERDARQAELADVSKSNRRKRKRALGLSRNGREISLLKWYLKGLGAGPRSGVSPQKRC